MTTEMFHYAYEGAEGGKNCREADDKFNQMFHADSSRKQAGAQVTTISAAQMRWEINAATKEIRYFQI
jgi:hypothetical protein